MIEKREIRLGNVLNFYNGEAINVKSSGDIPVYGSNGVIGFTDSNLFKDGIIIGRVGAYCGATVYEKSEFWGTDNTIIVKAKEGFDNKYLSYLLQVIDLNWFAGGSAQPLITHGWIKPIKAKIPEFRYQQKIAAILSAYDDLIENNLQCIKLLEEMAQITYEEWFVRMKFPNHEHTPIDPETGLPEGWRTGKVNDLFELQRGFDLPVQNRVNGDVPVLASTGIIDSHAIAKVAGPCVVTGRSGTIGNVSYIQKDFWPLNTTLWVKKFHGCGYAFAYFFLKIFHLERMSGGAAVPSLDRKIVHSQHIVIPSVFLMQKYELDMSPSFSLIEDLRNQNQLLKEARDILLPRLMTGMIDVDEIELPEALLARMDAEASAA